MGDFMKLYTNRIILRNFEERDFKDFEEFISQKELRNNSLCDVPNADEIKIMFQNRLTEKYTFAIELKEISKVIGEVSLMEADENEIPSFLQDKLIMDLGIEISKYFWKNGFATEVYNKIIEFSRNEMKLDGLIASFFDFNRVSKKLHYNLGFKHYGEINFKNKLKGIYISEKLILNYLEF